MNHPDIRINDRIFYYERLSDKDISKGFGIVLDIVEASKSTRFSTDTKPWNYLADAFGIKVVIILNDTGNIHEVLLQDCQKMENW